MAENMQNITNKEKQEYAKYVKKVTPTHNLFLQMLKAFIVGGIICLIGQGLSDLYPMLGVNEENTRTLIPVTLVFLSALLTALNLFDNLAKFAGAGTLVPITGFANAVVSPALDTKAEGFILGVGAKIFTIAGPVILYGTLASVAYGVILYIVRQF